MLCGEGLLRDVERDLQRGLGNCRVSRTEMGAVRAAAQEARARHEPFLAPRVAQEIERVLMRGSGRKARRDPARDVPGSLRFG